MKIKNRTSKIPHPCTLGPLYPWTILPLDHFLYSRAHTTHLLSASDDAPHRSQYSPSNSHLESRRCYDRVVAVHAHRHDRIERRAARCTPSLDATHQSRERIVLDYTSNHTGIDNATSHTVHHNPRNDRAYRDPIDRTRQRYPDVEV